jgi:hypothetical protein
MRYRSTFAMLTVLLLLTISCVASACETTCAANALGGQCHHAISPAAKSEMKSNPSMSGMSDCDATSKDIASKTSSKLLLTNPVCSHQVCEQSPTIVPNEIGLSAKRITANQTVFLAYFLFRSEPERIANFRTIETQPLRTSLLVFFQSTLRI